MGLTFKSRDMILAFAYQLVHMATTFDGLILSSRIGSITLRVLPDGDLEWTYVSRTPPAEISTSGVGNWHRVQVQIVPYAMRIMEAPEVSLDDLGGNRERLEDANDSQLLNPLEGLQSHTRTRSPSRSRSRSPSPPGPAEFIFF